MRGLLLTAAVIFGGAGVGVLVLRPSTPAAETVAAAPAAAPLGDLSALAKIVGDARTIAATGDLGAAEARITDFETAWDKAQPAMRPMDPEAWGSVDAAADAALDALRAPAPDAGTVGTTLAKLSAELAHPTTGNAPGPAAGTVGPDGAVATSDANGRALPCEEMAGALRAAVAGAVTLAAADKARIDDLQAKGLERCNADDDARADAFFAQALTILAP